MKKTLEVINDLKEKGLIEDYAIGGGIAAIFYTEPVFTMDLDIFVKIRPDSKNKIISLTPIYEYLHNKGYNWVGEHLGIEGTPVQFFAVSGLEEEAVENAKEITYEGVKTRVIKAEYLIAIALKVGRSKDKERITRFIEQADIDKAELAKILKRHNLNEKFDRIKSQS